MKNTFVLERPIEEGEDLSTGLPFVKTWRGAYVFVACSYLMWILALLALTECCS
jgi:hypothetical protein